MIKTILTYVIVTVGNQVWANSVSTWKIILIENLIIHKHKHQLDAIYQTDTENCTCLHIFT